MGVGVGMIIISAVIIAGLLWLIRVANKFGKNQEKEKNVKDKFKGKDLKKYMRAKHGY